MRYFIGIDGGGTKTAFACMDENQQVLYTCNYPTCHVLQVEKEEAVQIFQKGLLDIQQHVPSVTAHNTVICAGLAGYGNNQVLRHKIEDICQKSFEGFMYHIVSDADIALHGAFLGNDGILLIAGTGSIGLASVNGQRYRCGGWGGLLGDEGSAYWIAKRLLEVFTKQVDGRIEETLLQEYLCKRMKPENPYDVIALLNQPAYQSRQHFAKLALYVYELAKLQDRYALQIYEEAAKELAQLANTLSHHFEGTVCVSYAGGVWNSDLLIKEPFQKYCHTNLELHDPMVSPVIGACHLAKELVSK